MDDLRKKFEGLNAFLPPGAFPRVLEFIHKHPHRLKIARERKTVNGDYRPPSSQYPGHRISVNGNLNPYSFLVTLLHEFAHLITYKAYGSRVDAHGPEWKLAFKNILSDYLDMGIFPPGLKAALLRSLNNLKATTCSDPDLYLALASYDPAVDGQQLIEQLPVPSKFRIEDGRIFKILKKRRTRYECLELQSGQRYFFHRFARVEAL